MAGDVREPWRFVPVPGNVVAKHRALHERIAAFAAWAETSPYLPDLGSRATWVIAPRVSPPASSIDVIGDAPPESTSDLPARSVAPAAGEAPWAGGLPECREVFVIEETEPFVETRDHGHRARHAPATRILGKADAGTFGPEGELFRWQVREALLAWQPDLKLAGRYQARG